MSAGPLLPRRKIRSPYELGLLLWLLALSFGGFCGAAKSPKLSLSLLVSPQIGMAPLSVTVTGLVRDPRRELECPSFAFDWGEGYAPSTEQSDCNPFDRERPERWSPLPRKHVYHVPGDYCIRFIVIDGGRKQITSLPVRVAGGH